MENHAAGAAPAIDQPANETAARRRMSTFELLFRETICPATLPDDETPDEAVLGDAMLINGVASVKRLARMSLNRGSRRLSDDGENTKPRRVSVPPPPPPQVLVADFEEVQQAVHAAAKRRASLIASPPGAEAGSDVGGTD